MPVRTFLARSIRPLARTLSVRLLIALLRLVALVAAVRAVVLPINQLTQPGGTVELAAGVPAPAVVGVPGVTTEAAGDFGLVELHVFSLPTPLRLLTEAGPAIGYLGWAVGAWLLARALDSILAGRPFAPRVPVSIAGLALVLLVVPAVSALFGDLAANTVLDRVQDAGVSIPYERFDLGQTLLGSLGSVLLGAIVLVVAEAFRQGRKMATELEGLV